MAYRGYRFAVEWIAMNDNPADRDLDSIGGYISTLLLADMFFKDAKTVAKAILLIREYDLGD
jgi:hypothetical protein